MSICKLISEEIETIQKDILDISDLSPENYEVYLQKISDQVKSLEKMKNLLELHSITLEDFDDLSKNGIIDIKNLTIKNFASTDEEITNDTVVFVGTLSCEKFEKFNNSGALPNNLKFVTSCLDVNFSNISSIVLEHVGVLNAKGCNVLRSVSIKSVGFLNLRDCPELSSLKLQYVQHKLTLLDCPKLGIDDIQSFYPNQKIELGTTSAASKFSYHDLISKFSFIQSL